MRISDWSSDVCSSDLVGDFVSASRPVFTLVGQRLWVEGNFKENQLRYMRLGQHAEFKVDAFPDLELKGHVESFSPGTGNSFSLLPPENATGNWVKVVQRLPVERSEEHTSELQSLMRISYAVFCLKKKKPS